MPTPSIRPNKQYGDAKAIEDLKRQGSGMKQAASDTVPTMRTPVGRPAGRTAQSPAPNGQIVQGDPGPPIPEEHIAIMDRAARRAAFAAEASQYADDPLYGAFLGEYAARMKVDAEQSLREVKTELPDFDVG